MKHLIKITSALTSAAFVTLGFGVPLLFAYLLLEGYIIAAVALLIFAPCFIAFLAQEYR
tara:strand:+ start:997 stop:1173 length:177 start_codon:yes stop_codon:yes gene_type:complete